MNLTYCTKMDMASNNYNINSKHFRKDNSSKENQAKIPITCFYGRIQCINKYYLQFAKIKSDLSVSIFKLKGTKTCTDVILVQLNVSKISTT